MIPQILQELKETWGYETEELNDFREKLEEVAHASFLEGYNEAYEKMQSGSMVFTSYGKMEDYE